MKTPSFSLKQPPLEVRRVWIGFYSEMTGTIAMIFDDEPELDPILDTYSVEDRRHVASIWIEEWIHWFGDVQPFATLGLIEYRGDEIGWVSKSDVSRCTKVVPIDLAMSWDEHGRPIGLNVHADN